MSKKFSRHEQFLRIFCLLETLSESHAPLSDDALIAALRDRLGLSRLSTRTLRRDCDFLISCGYAIDHVPIAGERKYGWKISLDGPLTKKLLADPMTLLELVAFHLARAHLKSFEGTPLWTGIEMLRGRFKRSVPTSLQTQVEQYLAAFQVSADASKRYASRPRLVSSLAAAVTACRPIDLEYTDVDRHDECDGRAVSLDSFQPHRLLLGAGEIHLFGYSSDGDAMLIPVHRIQTATVRDGSFRPREAADRDLVSIRENGEGQV